MTQKYFRSIQVSGSKIMPTALRLGLSIYSGATDIVAVGTVVAYSPDLSVFKNQRSCILRNRVETTPHVGSVENRLMVV